MIKIKINAWKMEYSAVLEQFCLRGLHKKCKERVDKLTILEKKTEDEILNILLENFLSSGVKENKI